VAGALVLLTVACYQGVRRCAFLEYDDDRFVTAHPYVSRGLTLPGLRWALAADLLYDSPSADYWEPAVVLSRMFDVQLFGLDPAAHHATNVALHAVNVALLFLLLESMTSLAWPSAFVAAVFAAHPLHVESVAWVTERKDVLSGTLWLLTLLAYLAYVRAPGRGRKALLIVAFALALTAKPMLVTLPFALVLLDWWPLRRELSLRAQMTEKAPLLLLSALSVAVTVRFNLGRLQPLPWPARLGNAVDAYVAYLRQAFWPTGLAVGYPQPDGAISAARLVLCVALLAGITVVAVRLRAARPWLLFGWCWFLGVLVPVIGLLQVGVQRRADRYVYLALMGLSLAVSWLAADWAGSVRWRRLAIGGAGIAILAALSMVTMRQVAYWRDDLTLFTRAVSVLPESPIAHQGLATALLHQRGDASGAEREVRECLRLRPDLVVAVQGLAGLLVQSGRAEEAAKTVERALPLWRARGGSGLAELETTLGLLLAHAGRPEEAARHYAAAVQADPRQWAALYDWGNLLAVAGRYQEAEARYALALRTNPDHVESANNLALVWLLQGRTEAAVGELSRLADEHPASALVRTSLGRALLQAGRPRQAAVHLTEAVRLDPASGEAHFQLGRALAGQGMAAEARTEYAEAARLDPRLPPLDY